MEKITMMERPTWFQKQWSALLVIGLSSIEASRVATIRHQSIFPLSMLILRVNAATGLIAQIKFASAGITKKLQVRFLIARLNVSYLLAMKRYWFPVACIWNQWGSWELCTTTCGTGTMTRSRSKYGPFYGGADCPGSVTSSIPCNNNPCPGMSIFEWIGITKSIYSQCTAPGTTGNSGNLRFVPIPIPLAPPGLDPDPRMNRYTAVTIARGLHHLRITAVNYDLNLRRREMV